MYFVLFISTLLNFHLLFAAPQPKSPDNIQANDTSPVNVTNISPVQQNGSWPVNWTSLSLSIEPIGLMPINFSDYDILSKRLLYCPRGSHLFGMFCRDRLTRTYSCINGNGDILYTGNIDCLAGTQCALEGPGIASCIDSSRFATWHLLGRFEPGRTGAMIEVYSLQRDRPSAVINNYYGPAGGPVRTVRTTFVAHPGNINQLSVLYEIAAGSNIIDWEVFDHVENRVLDFQHEDITIVTFLSNSLFI